MATIDVTEQNFDQVAEEDIILFDFWASWCGPCRTFAPTFEEAAKRHPDVVFAKVDTEAEQGLARRFHIRAIPTLIVVRDGVILGTHSGVLSGAEIDELLDRTRAVDMEEVHRRADEEEAKAQAPKKKRGLFFWRR